MVACIDKALPLRLELGGLVADFSVLVEQIFKRGMIVKLLKLLLSIFLSIAQAAARGIVEVPQECPTS